MDIASLDILAAAARGSEMELLHPAHGTPTGIKIGVIGFDDPAVATAGRAAAKGLMSNARDIESAVDVRRLAMAKACVTTVAGMEHNGTPITSPDALAPILDLPAFSWIVDQIAAHAGDRASFFPKTPED